MRYSSTFSIPRSAAVLAVLIVGLPTAASRAQQPAPAVAASLVSGGGSVDLTGSQFSGGPGYLIYKDARMKTQSGATLVADELRANLSQKPGTGLNALQDIVATGHVKAHAVDTARAKPGVADSTVSNDYTVSADKAVFDPKANQIVLTGHVRTEIVTGSTAGPLVQTGDSATIQLGKSPDYPTITMVKVHTIFTPVQ